MESFHETVLRLARGHDSADDAALGVSDPQNSHVFRIPLQAEPQFGLPGSLSDLYVNIPYVCPPSAQDVKDREEALAQLQDPEYSRRLDDFLAMNRESYEERQRRRRGMGRTALM